MPRAPLVTLAPAALLLAAAGLVAGPLTPPSGPIAPTYKTLTEVEPRIPISQATTPSSSGYTHVISEPGSYYLTGNIVAAPNQNGVLILSSNVTLDLNGFTIRGNGGEVGVATYDGENSPIGVAVVNGGVTGFAYAALSLGQSASVRDVRVIGNTTMQYGIVTGGSSRVRSCDLTGISGGTGIAVASGSVVEDCAVSFGLVGIDATAAVVRDCTLTGNTSGGITLSSGAVATDNLLINNSVNGSGLGAGISMSGNGSRAERNSVTGSWAGVRIAVNAADNLVVANRVRTGSGFAYVMSGQPANSFPNNHVAQIISNPASPFAATNPLANIEH